MIQVENHAGLPLHLCVEQIAAFGRIDSGERPSIKSYVLMAGNQHAWDLRTEYDELERLILAETSPSRCKSPGIEYL